MTAQWEACALVSELAEDATTFNLDRDVIANSLVISANKGDSG